MEFYAYKGLETGDRDVVSHVVKKNDIILCFQSSYDPKDKNEIGKHISLHGDGVKDIAFAVEDCKKVIDLVRKRGVKILKEP